MPVLIDNTYKPAVLIRRLDSRLHRCEEEVGTHDDRQFPVHIDRHSAHDPDITGKGVHFHIRKDQFPCFYRLLIPGARPRVIGDRFSVFGIF